MEDKRLPVAGHISDYKFTLLINYINKVRSIYLSPVFIDTILINYIFNFTTYIQTLMITVIMITTFKGKEDEFNLASFQQSTFKLRLKLNEFLIKFSKNFNFSSKFEPNQ